MNALQKRLVLVFSGMLLAGCSTTELPKYQAQPFDTYQFSATKEGLSIALHPLTSREETGKYFGTDLIARKILPVFLVAENLTPSTTFLLSTDQIQLGTSKAKARPEGLDATTHEKLVGSLFIPFGTFMILPGIEVEHNYLAKEFQNETLAPGKRTDGFMYFHLPEKADWPEQWVLRIESVDLKSKATIPLDIPFSWKTK